MPTLLSAARLLVATVALLPVATCVQQAELPWVPPEGLDVAWFHDDCAPWDGPALSLYLSREAADTVFRSPFPNLRVSLYTPRMQFHSGERETFEIPGNQGHAVFCED